LYIGNLPILQSQKYLLLYWNILPILLLNAFELHQARVPNYI
jgi:hypothetical protein